MPSEKKYTVLDGETHLIGPGEYTVCGLAIPHGNGYTKEADSLCDECRAKAEDTEEFGAGELPAKKKAKTTEAKGGKVA